MDVIVERSKTASVIRIILRNVHYKIVEEKSLIPLMKIRMHRQFRSHKTISNILMTSNRIFYEGNQCSTIFWNCINCQILRENQNGVYDS